MTVDDHVVTAVSITVDWQDRIRWQDYALCHDRQDIFELPHVNGEIGESGPKQHAALRDFLDEKLPVARAICNDCPVFDACWAQAYETLPVGVIRAGAPMSTYVEAQRKKKLERSLADHQRHIRNRLRGDEAGSDPGSVGTQA